MHASIGFSTLPRTAGTASSSRSFESAAKRERVEPLPELKAIPADPYNLASIAAQLSQHPAVADGAHGTSKLLAVLAVTDGAELDDGARSRGSVASLGSLNSSMRRGHGEEQPLSNLAKGFMKKMDATLLDMHRKGAEEAAVVKRKGSTVFVHPDLEGRLGRSVYRLPTRQGERGRSAKYEFAADLKAERASETAKEQYFKQMMDWSMQAKQLERGKKFRKELARVKAVNRGRQLARLGPKARYSSSSSLGTLQQQQQRGSVHSSQRFMGHSRSLPELRKRPSPSRRKGKHARFKQGKQKRRHKKKKSVSAELRNISKQLPQLADFYTADDERRRVRKKRSFHMEEELPWWLHPEVEAAAARLPRAPASPGRVDSITAFIQETRARVKQGLDRKASLRSMLHLSELGDDEAEMVLPVTDAMLDPRVYSLNRVWTDEARQTLRSASRRRSGLDDDHSDMRSFLDDARSVLRSRRSTRSKSPTRPETPGIVAAGALDESSDDDDLFAVNDDKHHEQLSFNHMVKVAYETGSTPEPLNVIARDAKWEGVINCSGYGMGDKGAKMLSAGVAGLPKVRMLSLRNNRLSHVGACAVLSAMNPAHLTELDLSLNHIEEHSCKLLSKHVLPYAKCLTRLNLSGNKLGDRGVHYVCKGVLHCHTITHLLLRCNNIGPEGARYVGELMAQQGKDVEIQEDKRLGVKELDLAWNSITGQGGVELFTGLRGNQNVEVLDVSFNTLGGAGMHSMEAVEAFAAFILANRSVVHLDISHNHFNCTTHHPVIAQAFTKNHTVKGLHVAGNEFYVDPRGFLHPREHTLPEMDPEPAKPLKVSTALNNVGKFMGAVAHGSPSGYSTASEKVAEVDGDFVHAHGASAIKQEETIQNSEEVLAAIAAGPSALTFQEQLTAVRDQVHLAESGHVGPVDELSNGHVRHRIIPDLDPPSPTRQAKHHRPLVRETAVQHANGFPSDTCWLCAQWRPFVFQWRVGVSGPKATENVEVIASFDAWEATPLRRISASVYQVSRMVPSRKFHFLFVVDGELRAAQDELYERRKVPFPLEVRAKFGLSAEVADDIFGPLGEDGFLKTGGVLVNYVGTPQEEATRLRLVKVAKQNLMKKILGRWGFVSTTKTTQEVLQEEAKRKEQEEEQELAAAEVQVREEWDSKEARMRRLVEKFRNPEVEQPGEEELEEQVVTMKKKVSEKQLLRKTPTRGQLHWWKAQGEVQGMVKKAGSPHSLKHRFRTALVPVAEQPSQKPVILPRTMEAGDDPKEIAPYVWSFADSVFASYVVPNRHSLQQACNADWEMGKYAAFIKDDEEREAVRTVCEQHWEELYHIFKHYASYEATGSYVFNVGWNSFTGLCNELHLVDAKASLSALDRVFLAANILNKDYKFYRKEKERIPDRSLARFQFMEALVRVAMLKYVPPMAPARAVETLMAKMVHAKRMVGNSFRYEVLYTEEVDMEYKRSLELLKNLYAVYSGRYRKPGEPAVMSCDEWLDLGKQSHITEVEGCGLTERDLKVAFVAAMMIAPNEVKTDRHTRMTFIEFLEALGRVAYRDARQMAMSQKLHLLFNSLADWYQVLETTPAGEDEG